VITGEIGTAATGYTAIGEQVGLAQRMESVAPPGGVMLSASTARLVETVATLGEPAMVAIKGTDTPVRARQLRSAGEGAPRRRSDSTLVGRTWELGTVSAILDEAVGGAGCVVGVMGSAGIGKSRLVREAVHLAERRGVEVVTTYCESHTGDIAFRVVTRLLRAGIGLDDLDAPSARARIRGWVPDADPQDLALLDDLLGVADPTVEVPDIAPDARGRRLTALVNAASVARRDPAVYVIEDAHWIDDASESMLAEFLAVIPQTRSLVLITYRPEYHGALTRIPGAQNLALRPLAAAHTSALTTELLGPDESVAGLAGLIAERAAGNPFFVEEIVRDLAERAVLRGAVHDYRLHGGVKDLQVPATLQATIAARIDRLEPVAKHTLNAAAVVGFRFTAGLLANLVDNAEMAPLVEAELVDQMMFGPRPEYQFRHPLIRAVAYESQLKSDRTELHRRVAAEIEASGSADENAALIAEHQEAAGDLDGAYGWHMRAGTWSNVRDINAAHLSWQRARQVADRLPEDDPFRLGKRIAPRTLLCGTAWRAGGSGAETGFGELRDLCAAADDPRSLAIGMTGEIAQHFTNGRRREASQLATEHVRLLDLIGDPALTVSLAFCALVANHETAEMAEVRRLAQEVIDLAGTDPRMGTLLVGSPVPMSFALRGVSRWCQGRSGWRTDLSDSITMVSTADPLSVAATTYWAYNLALAFGALVPDADLLRHTAEMLSIAEQFGEDIAINMARTARGVALVQSDDPRRADGFELLALARADALHNRYTMVDVPIADIHIARESARTGDVDGAITELRRIAEEFVANRCGA
jgi:adenylate cyclase